MDFWAAAAMARFTRYATGRKNRPARTKVDRKGVRRGGWFRPRNVRYWLKNEHLPPETETIERILFGNDACYAEWRLELRQAHARRSSAKYEDGSAILPDNFTETHSEAGRTFSASNIRNDALAKIDAALRRYMGPCCNHSTARTAAASVRQRWRLLMPNAIASIIAPHGGLGHTASR
jgi:hypothetical protein